MNVAGDVVAHSNPARRQTDQSTLFRIGIGRLHHVAAKNTNNLADSLVVAGILVSYTLSPFLHASDGRCSRSPKQPPSVSRMNDHTGSSERAEGFPEGSLLIPSSLFAVVGEYKSREKKNTAGILA